MVLSVYLHVNVYHIVENFRGRKLLRSGRNTIFAEKAFVDSHKTSKVFRYTVGSQIFDHSCDKSANCVVPTNCCTLIGQHVCTIVDIPEFHSQVSIFPGKGCW